MNINVYKKKDGTLSRVKIRVPGGSFTFSPNGIMVGSSFKSGNLTTFNDATYNPRKYGLKTGKKTIYFNPQWNQYK